MAGDAAGRVAVAALVGVPAAVLAELALAMDIQTQSLAADGAVAVVLTIAQVLAAARTRLMGQIVALAGEVAASHQVRGFAAALHAHGVLRAPTPQLELNLLFLSAVAPDLLNLQLGLLGVGDGDRAIERRGAILIRAVGNGEAQRDLLAHVVGVLAANRHAVHRDAAGLLQVTPRVPPAVGGAQVNGAHDLFQRRAILRNAANQLHIHRRGGAAALSILLHDRYRDQRTCIINGDRTFEDTSIVVVRHIKARRLHFLDKVFIPVEAICTNDWQITNGHVPIVGSAQCEGATIHIAVSHVDRLVCAILAVRGKGVLPVIIDTVFTSVVTKDILRYPRHRCIFIHSADSNRIVMPTIVPRIRQRHFECARSALRLNCHDVQIRNR